MHILSNNKLVMGAAALVIALAVWYGFSGSSSEAVLGTETAVNSVNEEDKDIVETLLVLHSVDLSGKIFESRIFRGLQDFSTEITLEPVGREDPFAPLSSPASQSASAASSRGSSATFQRR